MQSILGAKCLSLPTPNLRRDRRNPDTLVTPETARPTALIRRLAVCSVKWAALALSVGLSSELHSQIQAVSGTYGGNVGAPHGNVTSHLAAACNGAISCDYYVHYLILGDPVPNFAKDYVAQWQCPSDPTVYSASAPAEAGYGSIVTLTCQGTANASFISQNVPTAMIAGHAYPVSITMQNTGTLPWTRTQYYRLGSQNPQDNGIWGGRIDLDPTESIVSGAQKTFTFTVTAPSVNGIYNFQWRMLQENVLWFGALTPNVSISVNDQVDTLGFLLPAGDAGRQFLTGYHYNWYQGQFYVTCWGGNNLEYGCPVNQPASKTYWDGAHVVHIKDFWISSPAERYVPGTEWIDIVRQQMSWADTSRYQMLNNTHWLPRFISYNSVEGYIPITFYNPAVTCEGPCSPPCSNWGAPFDGTTEVSIFQQVWGSLNGGNPVRILLRNNSWQTEVEKYYYAEGYGFVGFERYVNNQFWQGTYRITEEIDWDHTTELCPN